MRTVLPNHGVGLTCVLFAWGLLGVGSHVVGREFISYNGPHAYLSVPLTSSSYPLLAFSLFIFQVQGAKTSQFATTYSAVLTLKDICICASSLFPLPVKQSNKKRYVENCFPFVSFSKISTVKFK